MLLQEVKIKSIEKEDIADFKEFANIINELDRLELSFSENVFEYILSQPFLRENTILAYYNDKLVAFAACIKKSEDSPDAEIEVIVHPSYRKNGLGKLLFNIIWDKSKDNVRNVTAFAKERMDYSVKFMENRGFKTHKYMWKMDYLLNNIDYKAVPDGEYTIRQVDLKDVDKYVDIMNAGFKKEGDVMYNENSFQMHLNNPDKYVFFVERQGEVVATAAISMQKDIDRGYIHNVTVYKDYRGHGFGEFAINHCVNKIKEAGLSKAALNVDGENKNALRLYKKIGFEEIDTDIIFKLVI